MSKVTKSVPKFSRAAELRAASFDEADNSIDVVWTTGAAVRRYDWDTREFYSEVLEVTPRAVRLGRLNAGAPLLDSHDSGSLRTVIGSVVPGTARIEGGIGLARVRLSDAPEDAGSVGKIRDGIVRNVSVGYRILKVRKTESDGDTEWRVVDWEPLEISAVPVPADAGAQFRADNDDLAPVEFVDDEEAARADRAETLRVGTITQLANAVKKEVVHALAREHIAKGTSVAQFRTVVLEALRDESEAIQIDGTIRVDLGSGDRRGAAAIENALLHRTDPDRFPLTQDGREFRGLDLLDMARRVLETNGVNTRGRTRDEVASEAFVQRSGYHGTTDFATILSNVANASLRAAYDVYPQTFRPFVRSVTVADFKEITRVQLGEGSGLEKVNEHGEYKRGTIGEASEKYRIFTYGRIIGLTRQALINDNWNAFSRLPAEFGKQAARLESDLVWAQILSNPTMGADNTPLFHASHGNLAGAPLPLSSPSAIAALSAGRVAMAKQKGVDGRTVLNIRPGLLITGEDSRDAAERIVQAALHPTEIANVVPSAIRDLQLVVEPRVDLGIDRPDLGISIAGNGEAWWLAAAPSWLDTVELAYLEGAQGVQLETRNGFDTDGVELKASLDVGAKVIDWRAFYKGN